MGDPHAPHRPLPAPCPVPGPGPHFPRPSPAFTQVTRALTAGTRGTRFPACVTLIPASHGQARRRWGSWPYMLLCLFDKVAACHTHTHTHRLLQTVGPSQLRSCAGMGWGPGRPSHVWPSNERRLLTAEVLHRAGVGGAPCLTGQSGGQAQLEPLLRSPSGQGCAPVRSWTRQCQTPLRGGLCGSWLQPASGPSSRRRRSPVQLFYCPGLVIKSTG